MPLDSSWRVPRGSLWGLFRGFQETWGIPTVSWASRPLSKSFRPAWASHVTRIRLCKRAHNANINNITQSQKILHEQWFICHDIMTMGAAGRFQEMEEKKKVQENNVLWPYYCLVSDIECDRRSFSGPPAPKIDAATLHAVRHQKLIMECRLLSPMLLCTNVCIRQNKKKTHTGKVCAVFSFWCQMNVCLEMENLHTTHFNLL